MKVYKIVAYSSLAITVIVTLLLVTIPLRFTGYFIIWSTILAFYPPLFLLTLFLFLKPVLSIRTYRLLLVGAAILAIAATFLNWFTIPILVLFLLALGVLALPSRISTP